MRVERFILRLVKDYVADNGTGLAELAAMTHGIAMLFVEAYKREPAIVNRTFKGYEHITTIETVDAFLKELHTLDFS